MSLVLMVVVVLGTFFVALVIPLLVKVEPLMGLAVALVFTLTTVFGSLANGLAKTAPVAAPEGTGAAVAFCVCKGISGSVVGVSIGPNFASNGDWVVGLAIGGILEDVADSIIVSDLAEGSRTLDTVGLEGGNDVEELMAAGAVIGVASTVGADGVDA